MIDIEYIIDYGDVSNLNFADNPDDTASFYFLENGKLKSSIVDVKQGDWSNAPIGQSTVVAIEENIDSLIVKGFPNVLQVFLWRRNGNIRLAYYPDDAPLYSPNSPYRLYYGVDTEKLYMNIADSWQFIATKNHDRLENGGTLTHQQLEDKIAELERKVNALESNSAT